MPFLWHSVTEKKIDLISIRFGASLTKNGIEPVTEKLCFKVKFGR
jgi:hypothetical protein